MGGGCSFIPCDDFEGAFRRDGEQMGNKVGNCGQDVWH